MPQEPILPEVHATLSPATEAALPLCVDLDGTLVRSDTLVDSTLAMARQAPAALLKIPGWLRGGKYWSHPWQT